jgi:hypothetical protein
MQYILLVSATLLAATSAYFSVIGLSKIFVGIFAPFIILELGKFVAAIYLHAYWKSIGFVIKTYMVLAVIVLMTMTSTGIYGYLSAAAVGHTTASKTESANISLLDTQIKQLETRQQDLNKERNRLDGFVDKLDQGVGLYNRQKAQRKAIDDELKGISKQLGEFQKQKNEIGAKFLNVQNEVGPALYLAKTFYGNDSIESIEGAIRIVIYLIVFTFDPLAVVLLVAAQVMFDRKPAQESVQNNIETEPKLQETIENIAWEEPIVVEKQQVIEVDDYVPEIEKSEVEVDKSWEFHTEPEIEVVPPVQSIAEPDVDDSFPEEIHQGMSDRNRKIIDAANAKIQRRIERLTT